MRTAYPFTDIKVALMLYIACIRSVLEIEVLVEDPRETTYSEMT